MTDCEILDLILRGWLTFINGRVFKYHKSRMRYTCLKPTQHPKSGRYRYQLRMGDRQRTISRNKLHWMLVYRELIPADLDIDHIDHDRLNDDVANLRLRNGPENWSDNYSKANLDDALNFFDTVGANANGDF